jgi:hypothetical protein
MDVGLWRKRFIRTLRIYPFIVLILLAIAFSMGGFTSEAPEASSPQVIRFVAFFFIGIAPVLAIIGFIIIGQAGDAEIKANKIKESRFHYEDPFEIPTEEMRGYKLAFLTGREPIFTGLTGDIYSADTSATCTLNSDHAPPVMSCECGFYAFKDRADAKFELSINPGSYLLEVDLYGIGFVYRRGYRAETQVVNKLKVPARCMRCKTLPARVFVTTFKFGYNDFSWWQWQARCFICSSSFKTKDKLSIEEMASKLNVVIS